MTTEYNPNVKTLPAGMEAPYPVRALVESAFAGRKLVAFQVLTSGQPNISVHPEEERLVAGMTIGRRAEFAAGRTCARMALRKLANLEASIGMDADGVPIWPTGIVGSITHKSFVCAAAVALSQNLSCLGMDLERDEGRDEDALATTIVAPSELHQLARIRAMGLVSPSTGLLAMKEAAYKAAFPRLRETLDWLDIDIQPGDDDSFVARIKTRSEWLGIGHLLTKDGWIFSTCWQSPIN